MNFSREIMSIRAKRAIDVEDDLIANNSRAKSKTTLRIGSVMLSICNIARAQLSACMRLTAAVSRARIFGRW